MATKKKEPFIEYKKAPKTPEGLAPLSPSVVVRPSVLGSFLKPLAPLAKAAGTVVKTFSTAVTAPSQVEQPKQGGGAPIEPVPPKTAEVSAPAEQPPSELPPYFDMTPEEYIGGDIADQQEKEEELFGETLSKSTLEEQVQAIAAEGQQRIEFEKKQAAEKKLLEEQELAEKQKQTTAAMAGSEAAFAPNQEGMISAGAPLIVNEYKATLQGRIDRYKKELTMGQERRDELLRQMEVAQKQNKIELVQNLRNKIKSAEDYLNRQQTAYINAQADAAKAQLEIEKLGVAKVSSFVNMLGSEGIAMLSPEAVGKMFESNGLPKSYGMALQISQAELQEAKRKGDEFDIAQKQANLVKTLDGLKTEAEKKFEEGQVLDKALQSGRISEDTYNFLLGELKLAPDVTEAKKEEEKVLNKRRQDAIQSYLKYKQDIIDAGGLPDEKAGADLINEIQQSDNPELDLSNYFSRSAKYVKPLFEKKRKAGGVGTGLGEESDLLQDAITSYVQDIEGGSKTIIDIPARFRKQVEAEYNRREDLRKSLEKLDTETGLPASLFFGYGLGTKKSTVLPSSKRSTDLQNRINEAKMILKEYPDYEDKRNKREELINEDSELASYI